MRTAIKLPQALPEDNGFPEEDRSTSADSRALAADVAYSQRNQEVPATPLPFKRKEFATPASGVMNSVAVIETGHVVYPEVWKKDKAAQEVFSRLEVTLGQLEKLYVDHRSPIKDIFDDMKHVLTYLLEDLSTLLELFEETEDEYSLILRIHPELKRLSHQILTLDACGKVTDCERVRLLRHVFALLGIQAKRDNLEVNLESETTIINRNDVLFLHGVEQSLADAVRLLKAQYMWSSVD